MSWHRIDERREISADFITCAEYQLFLDEKRAQGEYRQPDHWDGYRFPKGYAQEPILGARGEDANQFCGWLGQRQGNKFGYRLPTLKEISSHLEITRGDIGCWCVAERKRFVHGLAPIQLKKWQESFFNAFGSDWNRVSSAFDNARPLDRTLDLNFDSALTRIHARVRILDHACILDRAYACAFDLDLDRALDRAHILAFDRARILARDLDLDLDRILACDRDRDLDRALDRVLALARVRDRILDLDLSRILDLDLGRILNRVFERVLALARTRTYVLDLARTLIGARILAPDNLIALRAVCCISIFLLMARENFFNTKPTLAWFKRLWIKQTEIDSNRNIEQRLDATLNLYVFFLLIDERRKGNLPAWEGIRIVRERLE